MIVVLADDFSGAAEIGGIAHRHGLSAEVQTEFRPANVDCVVVDANTRSLPANEAAARIAEIARRVRHSNPAFIYKKVDSVLRGPILAEAKSAANGLGKQRVLIANANPSHGRTVENGCLRIDGVPIDQTHFAMDLEHPRFSCDVSTLLEMDSHSDVPIDVADAREQMDLDVMAAQISSDTLLCGAADFFASLLRVHVGLKPEGKLSDFKQTGQTLVVCGSMAGSLHERDSRFVNRLIDLTDSRGNTDRTRDALLNDGRVGLYWSRRQASHDEETSSMASIVRELVLENQIDHLMVEGGRSASTIARRCGWKRLTVSHVFGNGVVGLKADGNDSLELVVKPGSYAWPCSQPPRDPWQRSEDTSRRPKQAVVAAAKLAMLLLSLISVFSSSALQASEFDDFVLPIIENHCTDCHGMPDEFPEGDFSMAKYSNRGSVLASRRDWKNVLDVVEGHEMPPEDAEDLSEADRRRLLDWIRGALAEPEVDGQIIPGKPVLRRLTRLEYNNTVRDLLGLETDVFMFSERLPFDKDYFDPAAGKMPDQLQIKAREYGAKYPVLLPDAGLPGDTRAEHGFTNRGDAQNLTDVRLDAYVAIAEEIAFHAELLSRAEKLQEIFPRAKFRSLPQQTQPSPKVNQIVTSSDKLAPNDNVARTADGSDWILEEFRDRLAVAFDEDRGGVYGVSENANTTIAGKGGVLHLAYGKNANRSFGVNPSEDIWNAAFATAEESSGDVLFTNKVKNQKELFFGFQRSGGEKFAGIAEIGIVVLSRRGQSGLFRVSAEYDGEESKTVELKIREGAGADNVFVSFSAPDGKSIQRLRIDGSDFSGDYVLLDDLAFITRDAPSKQTDIVGRETPGGTSFQLAKSETEDHKRKTQDTKIDRSIAKETPRTRLQHFMRRAFRRPVEDLEVDLYLRLYEGARSSGADDERALRSAIHGVLSSPSFLYLFAKGEPDSDSSIGRLTDHEIASRLSYFLWSSMPDDELLSLADRGQLSSAKEIEKQVRRMMKDSRIRELSENFFVEWLHLRELWSAQPDAGKFRAFYAGPKGKRTLARDMFCEPLLLFETILTEDRSILELVDSDYTYVNDRMAKHYGIQATVDSDQVWQRVELGGRSETEPIRGGVLTTGAVMTLTSFPHRTSPIRRGAWVLGTVFNRPPPPPKIAVADIDEEENVDHLTLREKVELHRANPACAVCHDRIDPSGFVFENFDAIGRWREKDGDAPIDSSGALRGIGTFTSSSEFKRQLSAEKDRFVRGFVEHLLSYALARELDYYDQAAIDKITQAAADDDYRLTSIIVEIATSHPFCNVVCEEHKVE